jgi:hypothetical protein
MATEHSFPEEKPRRNLIIVVAVIAAILIGGFFYVLLRTPSAPAAPPTLQGAIRPGSPEWEQYKSKILVDKADATQSTTALGGFQMTLETTVRNFTGKTITGLEMRAAVLNGQGLAIKDRTMVVIPTAKQAELLPTKTMHVIINVTGLKESDERKALFMDVTGFKLQ